MESKNAVSLVSVIIPVYNCSEYLPRCVDSLLKQTHDRLEIILVDDGSTDGSSGICDRMAESDSRVSVIHKPNGGVSSARNAGIDEAKGEFITFADADDYVNPDHIGRLLDMIRRHDSDVAVCGYISEDEGKASLPQARSDSQSNDAATETRYDFNHDSAVCELLAGGAVGGYVWNKLYRRGLLEGRRFRGDIRILEDLLFNSEVFENVGKMTVSPYRSYHYIQRGQSAMHRRFGDEHRRMVETAREIRDELQGKSPELADAGNGLLATTILWVVDVMAEYGPYDRQLVKEYRAEFKPLRRKYMKMSRIPFSYRMSAVFFSMSFPVFRLAVKLVRKFL